MRLIRRSGRLATGALIAVLLASGAVQGAEPAPPYPPAPPPRSAPPPPPPASPRYYPPPRAIDPNPPPLSPVMRVLYAPFYAAGLVVRYGVYYAIVAPLEVFSRAVNYGVKGGVDKGDDR